MPDIGPDIVFNSPEFWKYVSIPFVAALVGWVTNWLAIRMLFHPVRPIGKLPYFVIWGIIPSKAGKMGRITTETTLTKLGTLTEVFDAMEPDKIAQHLIHYIGPRLDMYIEEVMLQENPKVWELLPEPVRLAMINRARMNLPGMIYDLMDDIRTHVDDLVDIKDIVVRRLKEDRRIVNEIFQKCGEKEFKFIVNSGLFFGFAFGIIQMAVWFIFQAWWILPLFGVLVGYFTNWVALRIVFQPLRPYKVGPVIIQGLFLRRQKEVSAIWTEIVTREVLTVKNIIGGILHGKKSPKAHLLIRKHVRKIVDDAVGLTKPVVQLTVGVEGFVHLKEEASELAVELTEDAIADPAFNEERARTVRRLMRERMEALSSQDFQYLLRPAFQEDEGKLILLGAALGFAAGMAQLYFVFGV